jgi:hypothetical protein
MDSQRGEGALPGTGIVSAAVKARILVDLPMTPISTISHLSNYLLRTKTLHLRFCSAQAQLGVLLV